MAYELGIYKAGKFVVELDDGNEISIPSELIRNPVPAGTHFQIDGEPKPRTLTQSMPRQEFLDFCDRTVEADNRQIKYSTSMIAIRVGLEYLTANQHQLEAA